MTSSDVVTVNASVVDLTSGVKQAFLSYSTGSGWTVVNMMWIRGNECMHASREKFHVKIDDAGRIIYERLQSYGARPVKAPM